MTDFKIEFLSTGRAPRVKSDPNYPDGIDVNAGASPACKAELPYPAQCIGTWHVECKTCGCIVAVTAAGRRDDPRSVMVPCKRSMQ